LSTKFFTFQKRAMSKLGELKTKKPLPKMGRAEEFRVDPSYWTVTLTLCSQSLIGA
jgi:hypothetical protein